MSASGHSFVARMHEATAATRSASVADTLEGAESGAYPSLRDLSISKNEMALLLLNRALAECIDLELQCKHARRNPPIAPVRIGPELLNRIADDVERGSDEIAARIAQIGGISQGTMKAAVVNSRLPVYELTPTACEEYERRVARVLAMFSFGILNAAGDLREVQDLRSAALLREIARRVVRRISAATAPDDEKCLPMQRRIAPSVSS